LAYLAARMKKERPAAIFVEPQYPVAAARALASETGVPVFSLDPLATGRGEKGEYVRVMTANLATWERAFLGR
jgi:ABC-type Zn uptake system ZnuABC Zn-binding protein ZnuA